MRILLDECLPRRLAQDFVSHDVRTVQGMGWNGKKNGELLALSEGDGFEVFVTADQGLQHRQNLSNVSLAVVALAAVSNRYDDLKPLVPQALALLPGLQPGQVLVVP